MLLRGIILLVVVTILLGSLSPLYVKLFKLVFGSGVVPDDWLLGIIKPTYKGKGDKSQSENYRPIKLLSC